MEKEIIIKRKVFDDPKYCDRDYRTKQYKKCRYLDFASCIGFPDISLRMPTNRRLELDTDLGCYIKCDLCKESFNQQ